MAQLAQAPTKTPEQDTKTPEQSGRPEQQLTDTIAKPYNIGEPEAPTTDRATLQREKALEFRQMIAPDGGVIYETIADPSQYNPVPLDRKPVVPMETPQTETTKDPSDPSKDGQWSGWQATKNFLSGLIEPVTSIMNSPVKLGLTCLVGAGLFMISSPVVLGAAAVLGIGYGLYKGYSAYTKYSEAVEKGDMDQAELAFSDLGESVFSIATAPVAGVQALKVSKVAKIAEIGGKVAPFLSWGSKIPKVGQYVAKVSPATKAHAVATINARKIVDTGESAAQPTQDAAEEQPQVTEE